MSDDPVEKAPKRSTRQTRAVAWCATCGPDVPQVEVDVWLIGRRFRCQKSSFDDFHVAAVMDDRLLWWLRVQNWLARASASKLHPRSFLFGGRAGAYVPALGLALLVAYWLTPDIAPRVGVAIAAVVLLDAILYNTMVAFVTQHPRLPMRTVLFAILTFLEIAAAFGVFYRALPAKDFDAPIATGFDAFYLSVITLATVGYGDIHPQRDAGVAQLLAVAEVTCGLYFLAGLFAVMASWAGGKPTLPTLQELTPANTASESRRTTG